MLLGMFLLLEGIGIMLFSASATLIASIVLMLFFALFLKMSNGATYAVVPFINKRAIGMVSGVVGAGGNVGAVLAGFLFKSEELSYRDSLFIIGVAVVFVAVVSFVFMAMTARSTAPETLQPVLEPVKA
jgi:NNP family nitrate/nitrite transporter-like MFS transporter